MNGTDDRGIADQSALGMREATFAAGVWLTGAVRRDARVRGGDERLACGQPGAPAGTQFDPACVAALVGLIEGETPVATARSSTVGARPVAF